MPEASELREPKRAILLKRLRSRDMAVKTSEKANMHWAYRDLCGLRKLRRMACIDSRMLSTTAVASPCQILRELLAGDHEYMHTNSQANQLAVCACAVRRG